MIYLVTSDTDVIGVSNDLQSAQNKAQKFALNHPGVNVYVNPPCFQYVAANPSPVITKLDPTTSLVIP
jgi:hypothetical protein